VNKRHEIYLDHNATTFMSTEALGAMHACTFLGNQSSRHHKGVKADGRLSQDTNLIRTILNIPDDARVIFTSGATEANNMAVLGFGQWTKLIPCPILTSAVEHPSVLAAVDELGMNGWDIHVIPVDTCGRVKLDDLECILQHHVTQPVGVVTVMLANHETGVIQPIEKVARICTDHKCRLHVDATQAVGKLDIDFQAMGATSMSFSAHKFGGPVGIGCLVVRDEAVHDIKPLMFGGHHQGGLRPGTVPVAMVAGMAAALKHRDDFAGSLMSRDSWHRAMLETQLVNAGLPITIHGEKAARVPNTTNLSIRGIRATQFVSKLNDLKVYCSTGAACSAENEPSPTLRAMGIGKEAERSAIRFSVGLSTTEAEIKEASKRIIDVYANIDKD